MSVAVLTGTPNLSLQGVYFFFKDTDKMQSLAMGLGVLRHHGGTDAVKEEQCLPEALRESLWLVDSDSPSRDNWRLSRVH